jgi:hypothetical protein
VLLPRQQAKLARGAKDKEHAMSRTPTTAIAVIGIDIGKKTLKDQPDVSAFHDEVSLWIDARPSRLR